MLQVRILAVGNLKEPFARAWAQEFEKRLGAFCRLEIIEIKEEKIHDESPALTALAIEKEGERILPHMEGAANVALCVEGRQMPSEEFAKLLTGLPLQKNCGRLNFIIGGSYGLSDTVKNRADRKLSFSQMTFPHQLMRVILLEQIYRGFMIAADRKYHK